MPRVYVEIRQDTMQRGIALLMKKMRFSTFPEFVRWRAQIVTKDLILWTPPRQAHPGRWSTGRLKQQYHFGVMSILRDIAKHFLPLDRLGIFVKPQNKGMSEQAKRLLLLGRFGELEAFLRKAGYKFRALIGSLTWHAYQASRTGKKRHLGMDHVYVVKERESIHEVRQKALARVGAFKAGWMATVRKLGIKGVPEWIAKHPTPGVCIDQSNRPVDPFVWVQNDYGPTRDFDPNEVVESARRINQEKLGREMMIVINHEKRKAGIR